MRKINCQTTADGHSRLRARSQIQSHIAHRKLKMRSGFTLIELLLVLVILGVLAALVVPKFTGKSEQAKQTAVQTDISTISTALSTFEIDVGRYPSSDEGLNALLVAPNGVTGWTNPYLTKAPKDPWGNPYVYRFPGQKNPASFDLYSYGPDGRDGNDDIWPK